MSEVKEIDIFNGLARMGEVSFGINDLWAETLGETRVSGLMSSTIQNFFASGPKVQGKKTKDREKI